jgi:hypothetical protein
MKKSWIKVKPEDQLIQATKEGDLELIKTLIEQKKVSVYTIDDDFKTPLDHAILGGHTNIIDYLLEKGASVPDVKIETLRKAAASKLTNTTAFTPLDKVIIYASTREDLHFFNHMMTIGAYNLVGDKAIIISAGLLQENNGTIQHLISLRSLNTEENESEIIEFRELNFSLIEELQKQGDPNPKLSAGAIIIATEIDGGSKFLEAAIREKDRIMEEEKKEWAEILTEAIEERSAEERKGAVEEDSPSSHPMRARLIGNGEDDHKAASRDKRTRG